MNTLSNYESHVQIMKDFKMPEGFHEVREPFKEGFEKIYEDAKSKNITMTTAKDYLNSLSQDELKILQHFSGLADAINVGKLDDEGAYNLLLHHYEKFDFNNDGITQNGISRGSPLIPENMPETEKRALVTSLNEMDEHDRFEVALMLNPPKFAFINGEIVASSNDELVDFQSIKNRMHRIFNPLPGEYRSPELINVFKKFEKLFDKNYEIEKQKESLSSQNQSNTNIMLAKFLN